MANLQNSIGYARTSTRDQDLGVQLKVLTDLGLSPEQIFYDEGVSGSTKAHKRTGYNRMLSYIGKNQVEAIYCYEVSRLGRSFLETLDLMLKFEERGVMIISLSPNEGWTKIEDPSIRQLLFLIFSWVALNEKKALKERIKVGIEKYRASGKHYGRPFREPNQKKLEEHLKNGKSVAEAARLMNIPSSTMYRWIDRWTEEEKMRRVEEL